MLYAPNGMMRRIMSKVFIGIIFVLGLALTGLGNYALGKVEEVAVLETTVEDIVEKNKKLKANYDNALLRNKELDILLVKRGQEFSDLEIVNEVLAQKKEDLKATDNDVQNFYDIVMPDSVLRMYCNENSDGIRGEDNSPSNCTFAVAL